MENNAIELDSIAYSYRSDFLVRRIDALKSVSLTVAVGEAFGFLGPNGAGKTTTIKCLLGLIRVQKGHARIFGHPVGSMLARGALGYIAEQPYFYDYLTVRETLELYATLAKVPSNQRSRSIDEALERVGLHERTGNRMRSLSKGLTQRVALAQAIVGKPRLLILDEPFSGLDPIGRREFRTIFQELKSSGTTIFMSSHVLGDVEYLCDRASITVKGELKTILDLRTRAQGSDSFEITTGKALPSDLLARIRPVLVKSNAHHTVISVQGASTTQEVLRLLLDHSIPIIRVEQDYPSLEQLFMNVVER